jgi:hypothetical protein
MENGRRHLLLIVINTMANIGMTRSMVRVSLDGLVAILIREGTMKMNAMVMEL